MILKSYALNETHQAVPDLVSDTRLGPLRTSAKAAFVSAKKPLAQVEARVRSCLTSDSRSLSEISHYLLAQGGKRIRPLLAILAESLFGVKTASSLIIDLGAGIELIHMATLIHDDIIDQSPTRRHMPTAFSKYGLTQSLLTGNFLLARAFGLCAHLDIFIIEATEKTCVALIEGEAFETAIAEEMKFDLDSYLYLVGKKTASLFGLATTSGAHIAGANSAAVEHMGQFGYYAGIAFQMIDDILDIVGDEEILGKAPGSDLRQKAPSLVNLLWLNSKDPQAKSFFSGPEADQNAVQKLLSDLRNSTVIEEARKLAKTYSAKARSELNAVEHSSIDLEVKDKLLAILDYTLERCL